MLLNDLQSHQRLGYLLGVQTERRVVRRPLRYMVRNGLLGLAVLLVVGVGWVWLYPSVLRVAATAWRATSP